MKNLVQAIENIRPKIAALKEKNPKEQPTKANIIEPLLESLGWNVRRHEDVEQEFSIIGGGEVDYALLIDQRPVLLVEAKALGDPLTDIKAIAQIVKYAATQGIAWCVLTNGETWKIYCCRKAGTAPEKLMFEVTLDPLESVGLSILEIAKRMWWLSRDAMVDGTLDSMPDQTFIDMQAQKTTADKEAEAEVPAQRKKKRSNGVGYEIFKRLLEKPIARKELIAAMVAADFSSATAESYISWSRRPLGPNAENPDNENPFEFQTESFNNEAGVKFLRKRLQAQTTMADMEAENEAPNLGRIKKRSKGEGFEIFTKLLEKPIARKDLIAAMVAADFSSATAESYISWSRRPLGPNIENPDNENPFEFQTENFSNEAGVKFLRKRI